MIRGILTHPEILKGWGVRVHLETTGDPHCKSTKVVIEIPMRNEVDADELILGFMKGQNYEIMHREGEEKK